MAFWFFIIFMVPVAQLLFVSMGVLAITGTPSFFDTITKLSGLFFNWRSHGKGNICRPTQASKIMFIVAPTFLPLRVLRDIDEGLIWLIQDSFIDKVAAKFDLDQELPYPTVPRGNQEAPRQKAARLAPM
ncbi:hypothetical protein CC78DRAFT_581007 [Lojkania enalia]|uniref:Uncharacterized protein n=1 Tax=Lojkania enalia TaxID=147567 RepID=A0A9P4KCD3_9PLEO|nr:hypothetical protein CC78DRAFT_581007 [Didymosphaeria enalia]